MKRTGRKNSTIICLLGMSMLLSLGVCVLMVPIEGKASSRDVRVSVVESETERQKRESSQDVQIQVLENEKDSEKKETGNYGTVREENARTVFFWNLAIFGVLPLTLIFVPIVILHSTTIVILHSTMHIDFALPLWYYNVLRYILCMLHRSVQCVTLYIVHVASFCTVYHALSGLGPVYL